MGALIGEVVEGLITGIRGAVTRAKVADALESVAGKIRRSEIVSDEAIEKANVTWERMKSVRDKFKDE